MIQENCSEMECIHVIVTESKNVSIQEIINNDEQHDLDLKL